MHLPSVRPSLLGVDFTCAPGRRKPIVAAHGTRAGDVLRLQSLQEITTLAGFEALLAAPGPWLGAFDFPFGLPRVFVDALALGGDARAVIGELHRRCPTRMALRALIDAWGNARPPGQRLPHRATDTALPGVSSTSPLQTRYVPVGFMYYEGFARLVAAGVDVPGLCAGDAARVALEAYPGWLAHALIGRRSYKNRDGADTLIARKDLVDVLEQGRSPLGLRLKLTHAQRDALTADALGDRLDAVLCLVQAAWASRQPGYGLPAEVDPVEGWIVGAQTARAATPEVAWTS
ncbi:DUF429 domain-containing protein [Azohydromonas sediminis]|uniref:DUF429 domain-containing protein n=1 Tax=Azohydromonas sediminis TaxID=2259674 RepID=UPI000E647516|nr:DUF429 domain-containing protein [Azohydromonas sediminis]